MSKILYPDNNSNLRLPSHVEAYPDIVFPSNEICSHHKWNEEIGEVHVYYYGKNRGELNSVDTLIEIHESEKIEKLIWDLKNQLNLSEKISPPNRGSMPSSPFRAELLEDPNERTRCKIFMKNKPAGAPILVFSCKTRTDLDGFARRLKNAQKRKQQRLYENRLLEDQQISF